MDRITIKSSAAGWAIALLLYLSLHAAGLMAWAKKDTRPLAWDQAIHAQNVFDYKDRLATGSVSSLFRPIFFDYPPLYSFSLVPFLSPTTDVADSAIPPNFIYLSLIILSVFFIGYKLIGPWPGFTAALVVGSYPILLIEATQIMVDVALTAWVSVAVLCLVYSENFSKRGWSIALGVSAGLGMLTKWTALAYLLGPCVVSLIPAIKAKQWKNIGLASIAGLVIAAPWYLHNIIPVLSRIGHVSKMSPASGVVLDGVLNWFWYPVALIDQVNAPFLLLFVPGLVVGILKPKYRVLIAWFLVSILLFTLIKNRNLRYSMPVLPAVALLSVCWIPSTKKYFFMAISAVAVVSMVLCYFLPTPHQNWFFKTNPSFAHDWKHDAIIDQVQKIRGNQPGVSRVVVVSNYAFLHSQTLNLSLRHRSIDTIGFRGVSKRRWFEFGEFVLAKTGDLGPGSDVGHLKGAAELIANPPQWFRDGYKVVGVWDMPDGSTATLYHWQPKPADIPDTGLFNIELGVFEMPNIIAHGLNVKAVPLSLADTRVGKLKELIVRCDRLEYKTIQFENVEVRLTNPQINLPLFLESNELQMIRLDGIYPKGALSYPKLVEYLKQKAKMPLDFQLRFENSILELDAVVKGIEVKVKEKVELSNDTLQTEILSAKAGIFPIPLLLLRSMTDQTLPLSAGPEMPYSIHLKSFDADASLIRINP